MKLFLDSDLNIEINARSKYGWTAFSIACENGHKSVVQLLLDHSVRNIDYNAKCFNGLTGFIFACHCGHNDVVHLLLTQVLIMMDSLG